MTTAQPPYHAPADTMAQVTLRQLNKTYVDANGAMVTAVRDIDLEINDGEFMVLVGPSGCGKSTTLRMVAGLEPITRGTVAIDGRVVNDVPPRDRDIAMVFQNYALYPHMTVYENLAFGLKLRKFPKPEIDGRVREAAALLGLEAMLDRRPKALSGGQRQRVAVGRAIVRKPKVFLFDEPLSNLDAKMRVSMRAEIAKLHDQLKATVIYVTHDQVEAMTMGDRICVMRDGEIIQVDAPLEVYNRPATRFVGGFIGSPPMNFFRGRIERAEGDVRFLETTSGGTGFSAVLPERLVTTVRPLANRAVLLGVRPEDVVEAERGVATAAEATVEIAEPMGAETYLHLTTGAHLFTARVRPTTNYRAGQTARVTFRPEAIQLFDAESERRID
jgi:multiple sugar transport system ATP-binding protein